MQRPIGDLGCDLFADRVHHAKIEPVIILKQDMQEPKQRGQIIVVPTGDEVELSLESLSALGRLPVFVACGFEFDIRVVSQVEGNHFGIHCLAGSEQAFIARLGQGGDPAVEFFQRWRKSVPRVKVDTSDDLFGGREAQDPTGVADSNLLAGEAEFGLGNQGD